MRLRKLDARAVLEIRRWAREHPGFRRWQIEVLAGRYGVSASTVSDVIKRHTWVRLPPEQRRSLPLPTAFVSWWLLFWVLASADHYLVRRLARIFRMVRLIHQTTIRTGIVLLMLIVPLSAQDVATVSYEFAVVDATQPTVPLKTWNVLKADLTCQAGLVPTSSEIMTVTDTVTVAFVPVPGVETYCQRTLPIADVVQASKSYRPTVAAIGDNGVKTDPVPSGNAFGLASVPPPPTTTSPDGTVVPPATQIVDTTGALWTLGTGNAILRNGAHWGGGLGTVLTWCTGIVRTLGMDNNWWEATSTGWTLLGAADPCRVSPPPPPPPPPPPSDMTAPSVSVRIVRSGNSANHTVYAAVADASGITRVEFYVDGRLTGTLYAAPYQKMEKLTRGTHVIEVRAYDPAKNVGTASETRSVQ